MYEHITYTVDEPVAVVTLDRPDVLNAWTLRMNSEVRHALAAAEKDSRVVGIVLTGSGRAFCSGADMKLLQAIASGQFKDEADSFPAADPGDASVGGGFRKTYSYLASLQKPLIAAINGPCVGMALPIALYADLRFASPNASFMAAFPRRGLVAEHGSAWMLPRLIGVANAMDILLSGRKIDAAEAERIGLVNRVIADEDLIDYCKTYLSEMATHCSPIAMARIKKQVYSNLMLPLAEAYDESEALMLQSFKEPDLAEGVKAFTEKRLPQFRRLGDPSPKE